MVSETTDEYFLEDENIILFPTVKELKSMKEQTTIVSMAILTDETTDGIALVELKNIFSSHGIEISDGAEKKLYLGANNENAPLGEGYYIKTTTENSFLCSKGASGQYYAVITFGSLLHDKQLDMVEINDSPDVAVRGVIEGFYGEPWSHTDRLSILEFCGQYKLNTYIYAPKDDLKHREKWRELYTDSEKEEMSELISCAKENYVDFVYAISPGLDINYGARYNQEKETLIAKCESMYQLGVRSFALLLDDIPSRTAADAKNHAKLVNDFRSEFYAMHSDLKELLCVFTEYFDGYITEAYTNTLAERLNGDVIVMWTGKSVTSLNMSKNSFDKPNTIYNRKMMFWYNYPVNDYAVDHLFTDGIKGLSADLKDSMSGFVSNPMNQAEASKIPLFTIADYLWNSGAYKYSRSYSAAMKALHPNTHESVTMLSQNSFAFQFNGEIDSVRFSQLLAAFQKEVEEETMGTATDALYQEFEKFKHAVDDIRENDANTKFVSEITPWLEKAELLCKMGTAFINALKSTDDETYWNYYREFLKYKEQSELNTANVCEAVLKPFFSSKAVSLLSKRKFVSGSDNTIVSITTNASHYLDYSTELAIDGIVNTYFWSSCTPSQIAEGASFTLDLGDTIDVKKIYIVMGSNRTDSDKFKAAVVEISKDTVNWTTVYTGDINEYTTLENLNVNAQYVRLRCTDNNDQFWFKLREFSVNSSLSEKSSATTSCSEATATASLPCYQDYDNSKMNDGDSDTFYWSNAAATTGFNILLDFGKTIDVHNIILNSGSSPSGADFIYHGKMQYSIDKQTWTDIGEAYTEKDIVIAGLDINCRYIRYISISDQINWMSVSEFKANVVIVNDSVYGEPLSSFKHDAANMIDGDCSTYYQSARHPETGSKMIFKTPNDTKKIVVLQSEICDADVFLVENGVETFLGKLDEYYKIMSIPDSVKPDKIIFKWNEEVIPSINEVLFEN